MEAALEAVLPELGEPRVAGVGLQAQLQEVVVEGGDLLRLQLHCDASHRLLLVLLHHLVPVGPAVAVESQAGQEVIATTVSGDTVCFCHADQSGQELVVTTVCGNNGS